MNLVVLCFCVTGSLVNMVLGVSDGKNIDYRLNKDVDPTDYVIDFTPHFNNKSGSNETFTYDGSVTITLQATRANVTKITFHKEDLDISEIELKTKAKKVKIPINNSEWDERTTKYSLVLNEPLAKTQLYELKIKFEGKLRTDMTGFFQSSYKDDAGNERWFAATHMQPISARKAFPCFDEPSFKATFNIIINRPAHFQPSLCNTKLKSSTQLRSDLIRDEFEKTPKMSTYLVAFIVSEFQCRENLAKTFGICSRPNALNQMEYSLDVGQKTMAKYDELFDYKYNKHMSKMTLAAIPDFSAGAMENWGLLTFIESSLVYEPNVSSIVDQQYVAAIIAHEQTHMWFGNLVTCDWWNNMWLNEGFARLYQFFGVAMVEPDWGMDQQFVVDQLQTILSLDSLEDTIALTHEINSPEQMNDIYSLIPYNKAAAVIRMVEHRLGHNTFIAALRNYLKTNAFRTVLPEDLYAAFQNDVQLNDLNVTDFLTPWVIQPGYPVVNVNVQTDRRTIVLTQRKFLLNNAQHNDNTLWNIPISYATDKQNTNFNETKSTIHLTGKKLEIQLDDVVEWIVFNVQQTNYYRVNYDDDSWIAIGNVLHESHQSIHVHNRAQIVDDALNLARGQLLNYPLALHTVHYLRSEMDYIPWLAAFNSFDFILARFQNDDAPIFENFILDLLNNVYLHLGFNPKDDDTRLDIYTRNLILKYACKFGHKQCIADAHAAFNGLQKRTKIPVDLVPVVYCSVISEGSVHEWKFLWDKFQSENLHDEKITILNALGCTKQANLTENYLNLILTDNVPLQYKHDALVSTLTQRQNIDLVLDFVLTNHSQITEKFETDTEVPRILTTLLEKSTTSEQIEKVRTFVKANNLESNENLKTALIEANSNLKWAEHNIPIIKNYLKEIAPVVMQPELIDRI